MSSIILVKPKTKEKAKDILDELRNGKNVMVDSLEVIDELLQIVTPEDKSKFTILSGSSFISWIFLERMRLQRGLDPRS